MKIKLLAGILFLLTGCEGLRDGWDRVDKGALLRGALRAASLYVSIEHPELLPHVRGATALLEGDARAFGERRARELYRERLIEKAPSGTSLAANAALAVLADAALDAYGYNPELLEELTSIVDKPERITYAK